MDHLDRAIAASIVRIRAYVREKVSRGELTKKEIADLAGVHPNTVTKLEHHGWNPDLETIRKLERIVPKSWSPDRPSGGSSDKEPTREAAA
jgi:transcriptional regulator with XRE-family HTH domain